ncbi:MAG TPA: CheR family methyltransferase [Nostocaceae cyanobacterium]|nr:CheR family methyltransferase [Nostocaceae cyanobacterium]
MEYGVLEALLKQRIGLDVASVGADAIARCVKQRMADIKIQNLADYFQELQQSPQEWQALIDSVIIPETWFFREQESFKFLQKYLLSQWLVNKHQHDRLLRILSVPCATGEEPYSIAISLLEIGFDSDQVQIDALDISQKCIFTAQKAVYEQYSFRGSSPTFQQRYFQQIGNKYQLCPQVKNMVKFSQGNLADPDFLTDALPYDIIFCRNLLIYFEKRIKELAIETLSRLIKKEGLLFIGHGETGSLLHLHSQFTPVPYPLAFAYRKVEPIFKKSEPQKHVKKSYPSFLKKTSHKPQIEPPKTNLLITARNLADQGFFQEATQLCQDYLQNHPDSAEAYVLLGEMQQAAGEYEQAANYFHKAIYLQPTLEAALTHLALIREYQGNFQSAAILWQRIQRLRKKS